MPAQHPLVPVRSAAMFTSRVLPADTQSCAAVARFLKKIFQMCLNTTTVYGSCGISNIKTLCPMDAMIVLVFVAILYIIPRKAVLNFAYNYPKSSLLNDAFVCSLLATSELPSGGKSQRWVRKNTGISFCSPP